MVFFAKLVLAKMLLKCCYHITLILNEYRNNNVDYNGHYPKLPKGWAITSMQEVCRVIDGEKLKNRALTNLDARFFKRAFRWEDNKRG